MVGERFKFHYARLNDGESITDFSKRLEFEGDQLIQNLRDSFVCGLASDGMQKKLLSKSRLMHSISKETASTVCLPALEEV